jgi:predicted GNAT family acetyltransferase
MLDGSVAIKDYRLGRDRIAFTHTEVPTQYRKQGIAARLTEFALDDAVERGLAIMPYCPYTAWYIEKHPQYQGHVLEGFG